VVHPASRLLEHFDLSQPPGRARAGPPDANPMPWNPSGIPDAEPVVRDHPAEPDAVEPEPDPRRRGSRCRGTRKLPVPPSVRGPIILLVSFRHPGSKTCRRSAPDGWRASLSCNPAPGAHINNVCVDEVAPDRCRRSSSVAIRCFFAKYVHNALMATTANAMMILSGNAIESEERIPLAFVDFETEIIVGTQIHHINVSLPPLFYPSHVSHTMACSRITHAEEVSGVYPKAARGWAIIARH
jgi:hypothetical protein